MSNNEREKIKKIVIETLLPLGVVRIAFFGSFARNEDFGPQSDIDILVKLPPLKKRTPIGLLWFSLDQELENKIGRSIDLVSEDSLDSTLKALIEKDLEIIYEKAG